MDVHVIDYKVSISVGLLKEVIFFDILNAMFETLNAILKIWDAMLFAMFGILNAMFVYLKC